MSIDAAIHQPRLDVSGTDTATLDSRLSPDIVEAVSSAHKARTMPNSVYPNLFACLSVVGHDPRSGRSTGGAFVISPRASAAIEADQTL